MLFLQNLDRANEFSIMATAIGSVIENPSTALFGVFANFASIKFRMILSDDYLKLHIMNSEFFIVPARL